jgi:hypothetical protein
MLQRTVCGRGRELLSCCGMDISAGWKPKGLIGGVGKENEEQEERSRVLVMTLIWYN